MDNFEMPDLSFAIPAVDRALPAEIKIRCDKPFKDKITANARALNLTTSDYIRLMCSPKLVSTDIEEYASHTPDVVVIDKHAYAKIAMELRRIGVNINQMARALNSLDHHAKRLYRKPDTYQEFLGCMKKFENSFPQFTEAFKALRAKVENLNEIKTYEVVGKNCKQGKKGL